VYPVATPALEEWMGHRDIKTALIYADYQPSDHEVKPINAAFKPVRRKIDARLMPNPWHQVPLQKDKYAFCGTFFDRGDRI
jgi:hypothetical protein